jgi:hypothetical protein
MTGPAQNEKGQTTPYFEFLNADLAKVKAECDAAIKEASEKFNEWVCSGDPHSVHAAPRSTTSIC